jgi:dimethylaniline monooxygenase (N-oxide forming)
MKNLLEEGFDVTGFDRNEYIGGLWHYDERARISVLKSMPYFKRFLRPKSS